MSVILEVFRRSAFVLVSFGAMTPLFAEPQVATPDRQRAAANALRASCTGCHGEKRQRAELNIERALTERPLVRNLEVWENVYERVRSRQMPPEDEDPLEADERAAILRFIEEDMRKFDYSGIRDPGYENARRLTHHEYESSIRDLFGVDVDVIALLPSELKVTSGFDNSANSLFLHSTLVEKYLGVAERVVDLVFREGAGEAERRAIESVFGEAWDRIPEGGEAAERAFREILARVVPRAFRRPMRETEDDELVRVFRVATAAGLDFRSATKKGLEALLVSPYFLFRLEAAGKVGEDQPVEGFDLASRLSYFVWASMPDRELFESARRGDLREGESLDHEIERLLRDSRSRSLGDLFAAQWLGFEHVGSRVRPDPIDNPFMTDSLMLSMQAESARFFAHLVRENRPIEELVNARYTFLNEELAKHYRIDGVEGEELRRVDLETEQRGGIFGQASLLMVTSHPGRTSPVLRGTWILSEVLGTPSPPPPPNVSEFSREVERRDPLSEREKLELHRQKPACSGCHSRIDPLGFSLSNYDRFGRWRDRRGRAQVDARGRLPNWTEFHGPSGLKRVVVEQRLDDLTRQLARKMLAYALGRQLEYYDEPAVRKIVREVAKDGYRFHALVRGVANSYPFRYKRLRAEPDSESPSTSQENRG